MAERERERETKSVANGTIEMQEVHIYIASQKA